MESFDFRLGELFCGPGGIGLGAALAEVPGVRFSHVWATDIDRDSCRTYQHNIPEAKVIRANISEIRETGFARLEKTGKVNALAFGFPCNDFSVVGKQAGAAGAFGALYRHCVAAVGHFAPEWFLAENVAGLRSADEGKTLATILAEFAGTDNSAGKALRDIPPNARNNEVWCDRCHEKIDVGGDFRWAVCDADADACGLNWCGECRNTEGWRDAEDRCPVCAPIIVPCNLVG